MDFSSPPRFLLSFSLAIDVVPIHCCLRLLRSFHNLMHGAIWAFRFLLDFSSPLFLARDRRRADSLLLPSFLGRLRDGAVAVSVVAWRSSCTPPSSFGLGRRLLLVWLVDLACFSATCPTATCQSTVRCGRWCRWLRGCAGTCSSI